MQSTFNIDGLAELHGLQGEAQRTLFRRAMADLAAAATAQRPVPLEGLDPGALTEGVAAALTAGLFDDLQWLSPSAAAAALLQLTLGLPPGSERAELRARVDARIASGDGTTFAAVATALAVGAAAPFTVEDHRARVALSMRLPASRGTEADALALALVSGPALRRAWLLEPALGTLPARRLAARLLERAAREAARRAAQGDEGAVAVFRAPDVRPVWDRLLWDRESLVWRHVAAARGLLLTVVPEFDAEVEHGLDPSLSPTEWRRAGASVVASVAVHADTGVQRAMQVLGGPLPEKDRGLAGAMIFGIPRAAESEPRAAEGLLQRLVERGGDYAAETLAEVLRERLGAEFGKGARQIAGAQLMARMPSDPEQVPTTQQALTGLLVAELSPPAGDATPSLVALVEAAVDAYAERDASAAFEAAKHALASGQMTVEQLEVAHRRGRGALALSALRQLDTALLQSSALGDLLELGDDDGAALQRLQGLRQQLARFLLSNEAAPLPPGGDIPLSIRRLVTWLHLMDADDRDGAQRQRETLRTLLRRARSELRGPIGRVLCATLARTFDALLRGGGCEMSDVVLDAAMIIDSEQGVTTLAEASMNPELEACLFSLAKLVGAVEPGHPVTDSQRQEGLVTLAALVRNTPTAASPRTEALRQALLALSGALSGLDTVPSLWALVDGEHGDPLSQLAGAVQTLAELCTGARRRVSPKREASKHTAGPRLREIVLALEQALSDEQHFDWERHIGEASSAMAKELPPVVQRLVTAVLMRMEALPREGKLAAGARVASAAAAQNKLPAWMPPSRALGGFYVVDILGGGGVGSVFVATRLEDRGRMRAPRYALKVPAYDSQAARALSEDEFLRMFREEAGALLSLPVDNRNLAGFVTFDAGAKPKPVLVMELVEGPTVGRLIERGRLGMELALDVIGGVIEGLAAIHALGIGHLDIKPGNVVLRTADDGSPEPVLVDFGLSGRHLRPGCATTPYGAPEIWGLCPMPDYSDPLPADIYALGCLAYETLAARPLFEGNADMALISAHITHDGAPARVAELAQDAGLKPIADWLGSLLRQDPNKRARIADVQASFTALRAQLQQTQWPVARSEQAA